MTLKRIFKNDLVIIQSSPELHSYLIKDIKVDLVFDPLSIQRQRPIAKIKMGGDIFIDTLEDISSNKLCAVTSRFEAKDIIDWFSFEKDIRFYIDIK